jgi:hypothetical protein
MIFDANIILPFFFKSDLTIDMSGSYSLFVNES